jgi:hypothetical protein
VSQVQDLGAAFAVSERGGEVVADASERDPPLGLRLDPLSRARRRDHDRLALPVEGGPQPHLAEAVERERGVARARDRDEHDLFTVRPHPRRLR